LLFKVIFLYTSKYFVIFFIIIKKKPNILEIEYDFLMDKIKHKDF